MVQNVDGSWHSGTQSGDRFGTTGLVLVKLEDRAFEIGYDGPFDPGYPYRTNVVNGLNYMLAQANTVAIPNQIAGNPDTDGDGQGIAVGTSVYNTGILMMAIAAGRDPSQTVTSGPLAGRTYGDVLQDMADWMSYAQADTGNNRGGWHYGPQNNAGSADQSNSGYALLGLLYADAPLYSYESDIPGFVKTNLNNYIDYIQSDWGDGINTALDGGSGYTGPDYWVNSLKTGNLLTQMAFVGDDTSDVRIQEALNYIGRHWNEDWVQGWGKTGSVEYQATYCLMKGFETLNIPLNGVPGVANWFNDMADEILAEQEAAGSWPSSPAYVWYYGDPAHYVSKELSTAWSLLTLERFAPPAQFNVVKSVSDTTINTGDSVTYTYIVTNTKSTPISGVILTDDKLGVIPGPDSGDDNSNGILDPRETWVYTVTVTLLVTTTNTASATGYDDAGILISTSSNPVTVTVLGTPVPEFPAMIMPVMLLGAVFLLVRYSRKE